MNDIVILNEQTRFGTETGACLMRNRCAFTSRDMAADWKAKTDAATKGPWRETYPNSRVIDSDEQIIVDSFNDGVGAGVIEHADAEFIATARTAMPKLLAAVEAIRALHRPETRYVARGYEEYSFETRSDALEYGEEVTTFDVCVHCGRVETDDDEDRRYRDSIWPCATAKALDAALSGSEPN